MQVLDNTTWVKRFNNAYKWGNFKYFKSILPDGVEYRYIVNLIKRDIYSRVNDIYMGRRVRFVEGVDYTIQQVPVSECLEPLSRGRYSPGDYQRTPINPNALELQYLALIERTQAKVIPIRPEKLEIGTFVKIHIKDHFYDDQIGEVVEHRPQNNQYLVEIKTKRPNKSGFKSDPKARALMWVKSTEVKIIKNLE